MSPPLRKRLVTASLEVEDVDFLESLPGSLSEKVRQAVSHGCAALRGETLAPEVLAELQRICSSMESSLRRTATGNLYLINPEAADLAQLAPYDILVSPCAVLAAAPEQAITFSTSQSAIVLEGAHHAGVELECDSAELLRIAANMLPAILRQAERPERLELGLGLALQRVNSLIHLEVEGVVFAMPCPMALSLAAELTSLAVRGYDHSWHQRLQLEQALQGVAP